MKAIICTAYGAPEVLRITTLPKPEPKDNEVLVKIMATAVNSGDIRVRGLVVSGFLRIVMRVVLGFSRPRKPVLGNVLSGVVEAVGRNVQAFKPGDAVMASTGFKFGAYADYITLPANGAIVHKPVNASYEEAAAILFGGNTALYFLHQTSIASQPGLAILVYGASGSVGLAAVELARHYKANVTAVCGERGAAKMESLGCDEIIVYTRQDFTQLDRSFDIIFDAVGKTKRSACKKLLRSGGRYITVGGLDVAKETKGQLLQLKSLFEQGSLHAHIEQVYPFEDIVAAHRHVDTGRKQGNVVVRVN